MAESKSGFSKGSVERRRPPLVVHIIYRLAVGGTENGVINLINGMPREGYRHAIISLTDCSAFRGRLQRDDVPVVSLNKGQGLGLGMHARLWNVLRGLRPDIVHTRGLSGWECLLSATLAGVAGRVHGEHGRDVYDPDGLNFKYNVLRRSLRSLVHRYVAVSQELAAWLVEIVGVPVERVSRVCNGVDTRRFEPNGKSCHEFEAQGFTRPANIVVGTVGRMEAVKDPLTLVRAFLHLINSDANARKRVRLVMVGDGTLRRDAQQLVSAAGADSLVWFSGERDDVPEIMRGMDLFILPSLREGISNTILEAMASGLPVIATNVGGNPELVVGGQTGLLVPPSDPLEITKAVQVYLSDPTKLAEHGRAGRTRVEAQFSIESMVNGYLAVYDAVLKERSTNVTV